MSAERCPRCGAIAGPDGTLHHGLVHRRHEAGGGGVNLPCPNAPAAQTAADEREEAERFRKEYLGEWVQGPHDPIVWDAAERVRASGRSNVAAVIHATLDAVEAAGVQLSTTPTSVVLAAHRWGRTAQLIDALLDRASARGVSVQVVFPQPTSAPSTAAEVAEIKADALDEFACGAMTAAHQGVEPVLNRTLSTIASNRADAYRLDAAAARERM